MLADDVAAVRKPTRPWRVVLLKPYQEVPGLVASPPLGILYLVSAIREQFGDTVDIQVLDMKSRVLDPDWLDEPLRSYRPDVVGVSALNCEAASSERIAKLVKAIDPAARDGHRRTLSASARGRAPREHPLRLDLRRHGRAHLPRGAAPPLRRRAARHRHPGLQLPERERPRSLVERPTPFASSTSWRCPPGICRLRPLRAPAHDDEHHQGQALRDDLHVARLPVQVQLLPRSLRQALHLPQRRPRRRGDRASPREVRRGRVRDRRRHLQPPQAAPQEDHGGGDAAAGRASSTSASPTACAPTSSTSRCSTRWPPAGTYAMAVAVETVTPRLQTLIEKNLDVDHVRKVIDWADARGIMVVRLLHDRLPHRDAGRDPGHDRLRPREPAVDGPLLHGDAPAGDAALPLARQGRPRGAGADRRWTRRKVRPTEHASPGTSAPTASRSREFRRRAYRRFYLSPRRIWRIWNRVPAWRSLRIGIRALLGNLLGRTQPHALGRPKPPAEWPYCPSAASGAAGSHSSM